MFAGFGVVILRIWAQENLTESGVTQNNVKGNPYMRGAGTGLTLIDRAGRWYQNLLNPDS